MFQLLRKNNGNTKSIGKGRVGKFMDRGVNNITGNKKPVQIEARGWLAVCVCIASKTRANVELSVTGHTSWLSRQPCIELAP